MQADAPLAIDVVPLPQTTQLAEPSDPAYCPIAHATHDCDDALAAYWPSPHAVQLAEPAALIHPGEHA